MRIAKQSNAVTRTVAAPLGGWNSRDALGEMDPTDAVSLVNWYARTSDVIVRYGHSQYATGFPTHVESVMAYNGANTSKLFGVSNNNIYDATAGGAIGAASVTGLSSSRWEHINVSTTGGNFLYAVNGSNTPYIYDGSTWTSVTASSTPAITGVTTTLLDHINLHKSRVWFIEKNTLRTWYLPVDSVGGAANSINFRAIAKRGGYLVAMGTWTIDGGNGIDDLAVWITSEGEVIIYAGTDPSDATAWSLVGVYQIGAPIGKRCMMKWQGDLLIITKDGVVPLSASLQSSRGAPKVALTNKIQSAISSATTTYGSNFGWDLEYFAEQNMLVVNVPVATNTNIEQYVMNTITKAWSRFTGWHANCWEIFSSKLYFGGNGFIGKAWDTLYDNSADISATAIQAYNYFGTRGRQKRFTMMRPILMTNGSLDVYAGINTDFQDMGSTALITFTPTGQALWDSAVWDVDLWAAYEIPQNAWQGASGIGFCGAPRLQVQSGGVTARWVATDIVMEQGGVL